MKLSIAFFAAISLASFQTAKSDSTEPDCVCDDEHRRLMGYDLFEVTSDGRLSNYKSNKQRRLSEESSSEDEYSSELCICNVPPFVNQVVPENVCCEEATSSSSYDGGHIRYLKEGSEVYSASAFTNQTRPQGSPSFEASELLDNDIGLWKLHGFLNEDEVGEMKSVLDASSKQFWDCKLDYCRVRSSLKLCQEDEDRPSKIQPDGKQCLMVTDRVKEALSEKDAALWDDLTRKYSQVWPEYPTTAPMLAQIQEGDMGPFKFHVDGEVELEYEGILSPVTIILYLTDGGSPTYFPKANGGKGLFVTPKAGMAITWFNVDDKDLPLKSSMHGVPPGETEARIMIQNAFTSAPTLHECY